MLKVHSQTLEKRNSFRIKNILITQPEPPDSNSPYAELKLKYNVNLDFKSFIHVEGVSLKEFRQQRINLHDFTAIIFTSKNAVDNFFRISQELRIEMPPETKYFCVSDQTSNYLQKYIILRKRKVFSGSGSASDLVELFKKYKKEKYLYPCSDIRKNEIPQFLSANGLFYKEAILYRTVASDLSGFDPLNYDVIAFYSPSGVQALLKNFPGFKQKNTLIAAFGPTTAKSVKEAGLSLDIIAPQPNIPSMASAIEYYIKKGIRV